MENSNLENERSVVYKKGLKKASIAVGLLLILFTVFVYFFQSLFSNIIVFLFKTVFSNSGVSASSIANNTYYKLIMNSLTQLLSVCCTVPIISCFYKFNPKEIISNVIRRKPEISQESGIFVLTNSNNKFTNRTITFIAIPVVIFLNWFTSLIINIVIKLIEFSGVHVPNVTFEFDNLKPTTLLVYFFAMCVFAPLIEEFLFRGCIIKILKPFGNWFAVIISALFFALLHGNMGQGFGAFLIGLLFGFIAIKTNSILPTIILHSVNNFVPYLYSVVKSFDTAMGIQLPMIILSSLIGITVLLGIAMIIVNAKKFRLGKNNDVIISKSEIFKAFFFSAPITLYLLYEVFRFFYYFTIV